MNVTSQVGRGTWLIPPPQTYLNEEVQREVFVYWSRLKADECTTFNPLPKLVPPLYNCNGRHSLFDVPDSAKLNNRPAVQVVGWRKFWFYRSWIFVYVSSPASNTTFFLLTFHSRYIQFKVQILILVVKLVTAEMWKFHSIFVNVENIVRNPFLNIFCIQVILL